MKPLGTLADESHVQAKLREARAQSDAQHQLRVEEARAQVCCVYVCACAFTFVPIRG